MFTFASSSCSARSDHPDIYLKIGSFADPQGAVAASDIVLQVEAPAGRVIKARQFYELDRVATQIIYLAGGTSLAVEDGAWHPRDNARCLIVHDFDLPSDFDVTQHPVMSP